MILYDQFLPDQPAVQSPGMTVATNVLPAARGYRSVKGQAFLSSASVNTPLGAFASKANDDSVSIYVGDVNRLYKFNGAGATLDAVSRTSSTYSTADGERWWFARFKGNVYATNFSDNLQVASLVGGTFNDVPGSPPKARYIAVVDPAFLVLAHVEAGSTVPYRIQWSAIDDPSSWTIATSQSDLQDLAEGGKITGLTGGEFGTILTEVGVWRMIYSGPPDIFQITKVVRDVGCAYPGSVAQWGSITYFASRGGFHAFDGNGIRNIGAERVDQTWTSDVSEEFAHRMSSAIDPVNKLYCVAYASRASIDGTLDKMLVYAIALDKWSGPVEITADVLAQMMLPGVSGDSLDTYGAPDTTLLTSPDSPIFAGGVPVLGGTRASRLMSFTGPSMTGTLETGDALADDGQHSMVRKVWAFSDGTVSVAIASRVLQNAPVVFGTASYLNSQGWALPRTRGRFHRLRAVHTGEAWTEAVGADIDIVPMGRRTGE